MNDSILILIKGSDEQKKLMTLLNEKDYHWASGQKPKDIPDFLQVNGGMMIHTVNPETKTIGFFPIEVFDELHQLEFIEKTSRLQDIDPEIL